MRKRHEDLLGTNDHNEIIAHLLEEVDILDRRLKALESAAEESAAPKRKAKD